MREHRVTIGRGTGRVNLKQQSTGIEGLVPQYFDVSFYIVKLVLYNLFQTDVFDKCIRNIHEYFAVTISHVLLLSKILKRIRQKKIHFGSLVHFGLVSPPPTPPPLPHKKILVTGLETPKNVCARRLTSCFLSVTFMSFT